MQEVHTISIGNGHACAFDTGPGPDRCPTSCQTNKHFIAAIDSRLMDILYPSQYNDSE